MGRTPAREALASSRMSQGSTSSMLTLCCQVASALRAGAPPGTFISCWVWGSRHEHMCPGVVSSAGPLAGTECTQGHSFLRTESGPVARGKKRGLFRYNWWGTS